MSDVNAFIEAIGRDVTATTTPRVEKLAKEFGDKALADYVPKVSAFADQLVQQIVAEQSVVLRDFATATTGIVSNAHRTYGTLEMIQTSAPVNHGNLCVKGRFGFSKPN